MNTTTTRSNSLANPDRVRYDTFFAETASTASAAVASEGELHD